MDSKFAHVLIQPNYQRRSRFPLRDSEGRLVIACNLSDLMEKAEEHKGQENVLFTLSKINTTYDIINKDLLDKEDGLQVSIIGFDIDHTPAEKAGQYIEAFANLFQIPKNNVVCIHTGNGLHIMVESLHPMPYRDWVTLNCSRQDTLYRRAYEIFAKKAGLVGEQADWKGLKNWHSTSRLPWTKNVKESKVREVTLLSKGSPVHATIPDLINATLPINQHKNLEGLKKKEEQNAQQAQVQQTKQQKRPTDIGNCAFLTHCKENQAETKEDQWLTALRILRGAHDGLNIAHEISKEHPSYSEEETDRKFNHAGTFQFRPTCKGVDKLWSRCKECKHFGKVRTPGEALGGKQDWNYWLNCKFRLLNKDGNLSDRIEYSTLYAYLLDKFEDKILYDRKTKLIYSFHENVWEAQSILDWLFDNVFIKNKLLGALSNHDSVERNIKKGFPKEIPPITEGILNPNSKSVYFKDTIYNIITGELTEHSPETSTTFVLDFKYTDKSTPEMKKKWMDCLRLVLLTNRPDGPTEEDEKDYTEKELVLRAFMGYTLSGIMPTEKGKMLFCLGEGANGKSFLFKIFSKLFDKYSGSFMVKDMKPFSLHDLGNKLLCIDTDVRIATEKKSLRIYHDSTLKNMVTGEPVERSRKNENTIREPLKTKLVALANEFPTSEDKSKGFRRRFLFLHFKNTFEDKDQVGLQKEYYDYLATLRTNPEDKGIYFPTAQDYIIAKYGPAIIDWMVSGLRYMVKNNFTLPECKADQEEIQELIRSTQSNVVKFIEGYVTLRPRGEKPFTPGPKLRQVYQHYIGHFWANENLPSRPLPYQTFARQFAQALEDNGYVPRNTERKQGGRDRHHTVSIKKPKSTWHYRNLDLLDVDEVKIPLEDLPKK